MINLASKFEQSFFVYFQRETSQISISKNLTYRLWICCMTWRNTRVLLLCTSSEIETIYQVDSSAAKPSEAKQIPIYYEIVFSSRLDASDNSALADDEWGRMAFMGSWWFTWEHYIYITVRNSGILMINLPVIHLYYICLQWLVCLWMCKVYHTRPCAYQWFQGCACKVCETHRLKVKWQKRTG